MLLQASYGVNLLRFFGNIDGLGKAAGYGYVDTTDKSILVSIDPITLQGTYNETNFRRFDLVLAEACKISVYLQAEPCNACISALELCCNPSMCHNILRTQHDCGAILMTYVCCAAKAGTYCIVTLVNGAALGNTTHPAVAGGMQWYVDQVLGNGSFGSGGSYNRFYTNANVIQAGHTCQWSSHVTSTSVIQHMVLNCEQSGVHHMKIAH